MTAPKSPLAVAMDSLRPGHYFDKDGQPITWSQYADLFEQPSYKRVALDTLPNGRKVSTVWLGSNHAFFGGPPLIFESMCFPGPADGQDELDCERYSTLEEAKAGHAAMVAKWRDAK